MKAMILAAGYGTRLKPLTNTRPKALVQVVGTTLLEIVIRKLIKIGVSEIILNTHHFAEMVEQFLLEKNNFGIRIEISFESIILGTGGGLKKAAYFFDDEKPFILHNVDVVTNINLLEIIQSHQQHIALATLVVQKRDTTRYLLLDSNNHLCGRRNITSNEETIVKKPAGTMQMVAFNGIHVLSPNIFKFMENEGYFSIIKTYLTCAAKGEKIMGFFMENGYWKDVGKLSALRTVEGDIQNGKIIL